jgi:hypothetical protein
MTLIFMLFSPYRYLRLCSKKSFPGRLRPGQIPGGFSTAHLLRLYIKDFVLHQIGLRELMLPPFLDT